MEQIIKMFKKKTRYLKKEEHVKGFQRVKLSKLSENNNLQYTFTSAIQKLQALTVKWMIILLYFQF